MVRPLWPAASTITFHMPANNTAAQMDDSMFVGDYSRSRIDKSEAYGVTNNN